jgi:hypothetical protein
MISTGQIIAAGAVTALGAAIAAWAVRWPRSSVLSSAVGAFLVILAWRGLCNLVGLNGDFVPAVSIGDAGCLVAGALAPFAVARFARVPDQRRWVPPVVAAVIGFLVNVLIL